MGNNGLSTVFKDVGESLHRHSPEILLGFGIAGMIGAIVLAVAATPKAIEHVEEVKAEKEEANAKDILKATWKDYAPTVIASGLSIACLICSNRTSSKRGAALASAYSLTQTAFNDYKKSVIETIGEKKEREVVEASAKKKLERDPVEECNIIRTKNGNTLFYDSASGRYFTSDIEFVRKVENDLNRSLRDEMSITLNTFYDSLGLDLIGLGDSLGWDIDKGYLDISFSAQIAYNNEPCIVIDYSAIPLSYGYRYSPYIKM